MAAAVPVLRAGAVAAALSAAGSASPRLLREHPIVSSSARPPLYLDGNWSLTHSPTGRSLEATVPGIYYR